MACKQHCIKIIAESIVVFKEVCIVAKKRANGEGTIRQRKDGRWEGLYSLNYKRKSVYGKTQDEVRKKLNKILNDIDNHSYIANPNISFGAWLDEWLDVYVKPNVKLSTYGSYERQIRLHIKPEIGRIKLKDLTANTLQKLLNKKRNEGLSASSVRGVFKVISCAYKEAYRNNYVKRNICDLVTLPKEQQREMRVFTLEEQQALQDALEGERLGIGVLLSLYTGMRIGEILGLKFSDIDFKERTVTVRRSLNRLTLYDNSEKKTDIVISEPKTSNSNRVIPLQKFLIPLLKEHKQMLAVEKKRVCQLYNDNDFVICNEYGKCIEPRTYQVFFKNMLEKAKIETTHFHTLRHTFATRALEFGFDVKVLASVLGHANASTTLNKYAHALPDHKKQSMEKLSSLYI